MPVCNLCGQTHTYNDALMLVGKTVMHAGLKYRVMYVAGDLLHVIAVPIGKSISAAEKISVCLCKLTEPLTPKQIVAEIPKYPGGSQ